MGRQKQLFVQVCLLIWATVDTTTSILTKMCMSKTLLSKRDCLHAWSHTDDAERASHMFVRTASSGSGRASLPVLHGSYDLCCIVVLPTTFMELFPLSEKIGEERHHWLSQLRPNIDEEWQDLSRFRDCLFLACTPILPSEEDDEVVPFSCAFLIPFINHFLTTVENFPGYQTEMHAELNSLSNLYKRFWRVREAVHSSSSCSGKWNERTHSMH